MSSSIRAVTILGTFGRTAVRPSALTYNPAVIFTLNQDRGRLAPRASIPHSAGEELARSLASYLRSRRERLASPLLE